MSRIEIKRFSAPDETRPFEDLGRAEILKFDEGEIGRGFFEPGWRWSTHVKPIAETESCQAAHTCYIVQGSLHVVLDDGQEADLNPGDIAVIPPGHDAWTVGDQTCVVLDFSGMEGYAVPRGAKAEKEAPSEQPSP